MSRFVKRLRKFIDQRNGNKRRGALDVDERLASRAQTARSKLRNGDTLAIKEIVRQAWSVGQTIELPDAFYGPAHWGDGKAFHNKPLPYYFFLAGFVRSQNCRSIFEIGSHYGGSALAMLHGIADKNAAGIVTVDISDLNDALHHTLGISKLTGDANDEATIKQAILCAGNAPIDLLYVDADHRFLPTITNLALYVLIMRPHFAIIDDILLNSEMRTMWDAVRAAYGPDAVNCVEVVSEIRDQNVGFGLCKVPIV